MATLDRIDPAYMPWTPSSAGIATEDEIYTGRHRRPSQGGKTLSLSRLFYSAKHRTR